MAIEKFLSNIVVDGTISKVGGTASQFLKANGSVDSNSYELAFAKNTAFNKNFGTTAGTTAQGNDSRFTDARTPLAHNQAWSTITSTPTLLSGYGITNAASINTSVSDIYNITMPNNYGFFASNSTTPTNSPSASADWVQGIVFPKASNTAYQQIIASTASDLYYGSESNSVWSSWRKILDSGNFNTYAPTLSGTGATGLWGIGISGNATTATTLQNARTINNVSFNGSANITIADATKLPLAGGSLTGTLNIPTYSSLFVNGSLTNYYTGNSSTSIAQTPLTSAWHDVLAFKKAYTTTIENSVDGAAWTAGTLNLKIFAQKQNQSIVIINKATQKAVRWTFSSVAYNSAAWLLIGYSYDSTGSSKTVLIESSVDTVTWTPRHTSTYTLNGDNVNHYINGYGGDTYLRVTITKMDAGVTGTININSIKLLTARPGDQGLGSELSYPYTWDENQNVVFPSTVSSPRVISTITTGTSPLLVASTTVVANLNADLLDGFHSSNFSAVGATFNIGTTSIANNRASLAQTLTGVSIDGNSGTTTLAANSTAWNGLTYLGTDVAVNTFLMGYGADNKYHPIGQANVRTFLGLGSSAYTNTSSFIQNQNASAQSANMWISGSGLFGSGDNSILTIDGNERRLGFTKKAGFAPNLAFGNTTFFTISESSGANIDASNTFTPRLTIAYGGAATFSNSVTASKYSWTGGTTTPVGKVTVESAFYNLGSSYGYGISTNNNGGLDIMANQAGQPIRFWAGTDNTSPTKRLEISGDGNTVAYGSITAQRLIAGYDSGVAGSVNASNWFRSSGATGWYNQTYNGGIYMRNSDYVEVSAGRKFKVENTIEASGTGGFASSTFATGVRNPIWRFGDADAYGLSYFQGTAGLTSGIDTIGFHFGTATAAASQFTIGHNGTVRATGAITATAFFTSSDIRLKKLHDTTYDESKVLDIQLLSYTWKDKKRDQKVQIGYSAQEVQKVMPDAVETNEEGMLSVNYIQVLIAKVQALENRIKQLEYAN